jgi:hypothetical protein
LKPLHSLSTNPANISTASVTDPNTTKLSNCSKISLTLLEIAKKKQIHLKISKLSFAIIESFKQRQGIE